MFQEELRSGGASRIPKKHGLYFSIDLHILYPVLQSCILFKIDLHIRNKKRYRFPRNKFNYKKLLALPKHSDEIKELDGGEEIEDDI
jgi:hypothetical protein